MVYWIMLMVAVCDDNKETAAFLQRSLAAILTDAGVAHDIAVFHSASGLCGTFKNGADIALIFLDIEFGKGEMDGVQAGTFIRKTLNNNSASIVYISWTKRYSYHLIKTRPTDFLIKPLTYESIKEVVTTYLRIANPNAGGYEFAYRKDRSERLLKVKDIVYLEARDRKIIIHLSSGTQEEFYGALKDIYQRQLENLDFLFIHASYAVNFDYVAVVKYDSLHLSGIAFPLPITQDRRKAVRDKYTEIRQRRAGG